MSEKKDSNVSRVVKYRDDSILGWEEPRKSSKSCREYINNNQYTEAEKDKAEEYNKPTLTYNVLVSKLNVLLGNEQLNRREAKIIEKYATGSDLIQVMQDNWRHIIEENKLNDKLNLVMADALINATGGWIRRKIKTNEWGYLEFQYDLLDGLSDVHPDPNFRKYNLEDCHYVIIDDWLTPEQIVEEYGDMKFMDRYNFEDDLSASQFTPEDKEEDTDYYKGGRLLVSTLEEKVTDVVYKVLVNGDYYEVTRNEIDESFSLSEINILDKKKETRIERTVVVPEVDKCLVDKEMFPFPTDRFSTFPCFSFDYNMTKSSQSSLMAMMQSPQDRLNKNESQKVDYISKMLGKKTWIPKYEKEAINTIKKNKGNPNLVVPVVKMDNAGKSDKDINIPPALFQETNVAKGFVYDISGINPAMEGFSEKSGESGVLFDAKLGQGHTSVNPFFENLAKTRRMLAQDYCELAPYVYFEDDRILEKQGENGLSYELINLNYNGDIVRDIRQLDMKASLDNAENTPDRLQKTFEQNLALVNILIQSGGSFADIPWEFILKHSQLRDKEGWIKFLKQRQNLMQQKLQQQNAQEQAEGNIAIAQGMEQVADQNTNQQTTPNTRENGEQ